MPIDFWKKVVRSDENKFELFNRKTRLEYGENPERNIKSVTCSKHRGGSMMIWGCFTWSGVGNLVKIDGIINGR